VTDAPPRTPIEIVEVAPRDGLQNEKAVLDTQTKVSLIARAVAAGVRRIEVASFVNPHRVPQMADAEAVIAALPSTPDVTTIGLVLNERGADRALATSIDELGAVCVASDALAIRNQGQSSAESLHVARRIVEHARSAGRSAQITIGAAFGCPFEGEVTEDRVVELALRAAESSPREVALADTIGVAVPMAVATLVARVRTAIAPIPVRVHLHNTRNTGIANAWAAVMAGARTIDASIGGFGGCPFAPGAAGNVATEDLIYMLHRSGVPTGLDLQDIISAAGWLGEVLRRDVPGMVTKAGPFPTSFAQGSS
jgi:hydroxymethylglutaryl-CoA lyase